MKTSKSNKPFVSTLAIWAWLLRPSETESAIVRRYVPCDVALERQKLEDRLMDVQRNARCVWRAVQLMLFLTGLAIVGLGHTTVLIPEWPYTITRFMMEWPIKASCAVGLASLSCAFLFFGLGLRYRMELIWLRLECSRLAGQIIPSGDSRIIPLPVGTAGEHPLAVNEWTGKSIPDAA